MRKIELEVLPDTTVIQKVSSAFKNTQGDPESQKLSDFEKNFGLRVKKFCDDKVVGNRWKGPKDEIIGDEYIDDAIQFRDSIKGSFLKYRTDFRQVIDQLRTTEYESFASIGLERKRNDPNIDKKIEIEKELLKQRIKNAGNSRKLFSDLVEIEESSEENDDDFYKNDSSEEESRPVEDNEATVINTKTNKPK